MPLKTRRVGMLMHVKSAVSQNPHVGVVSKLGQWSQVLSSSSDRGSKLRIEKYRRGSLVVKVTHSWPAFYVFEPSTAENPLCGGVQCPLNLSRFKRPLVGVECYWARAHDMPAMIRYLDPWATAALPLCRTQHARPWALRSGGYSDVKPPVLNSQASLVLIYRPTEEMKG
ncbi:hypothetical protein TNCV_1606361 [Trichonephila clavipes]|nr:hypothetical protein TNCV_1606361 [Trichonephila clavipes]